MKYLFFTLITCLIVTTSLKSQSNEQVFLAWDLEHSALTGIEERLAEALIIEAELAFVIPTGKRRLSYILKFDIDDSEFDKIGSYFLDIELWADTDGDRLFYFLNCNRELPYMFIDDETMLEYNNPNIQPCLGKELILYLSSFESNGKIFYNLLKLENKQ